MLRFKNNGKPNNAPCVPVSRPENGLARSASKHLKRTECWNRSVLADKQGVAFGSVFHYRYDGPPIADKVRGSIRFRQRAPTGRDGE